MLGLKLIIRGSENLNSSFPCVYIANHQHSLDLVVGGRIIPRRTIAIGKKSVKYIPFFGQFFWIAGNILIDRKNKKNALTAVNRAAEILIKKISSIFVFPEGTRNYGEGLLNFERGAFTFKLAIKASVPIIPICISTYIKNADFKRWNSGIVFVEVLEPIFTKDLKLSDASKLSDECHKKIQIAVRKLNTEYNGAKPHSI